MNAGVISSRYAKALLKFVQETGAGEKVYSQVCTLLHHMKEVGSLADAIQKHPEISLERKLELIDAAIGIPSADELKRFVCMVHMNGRNEFLQRIFQSFVEQYRELKGIRTGRLVTAVPAPGMKERLQKLVHDRTGDDVLLDEYVDPSIIGGFVLEVDDLRMDASVESQLRRLRRELVEDADRIV